MPMIRVLLADDHAVVRKSVSRLLRRERDIVVVGEATDGLEALRLAQELEPDVMLLDIRMPRMGGIEVTQRLRASGAQVKVLALSSYVDRQYILGVLNSGATGYLSKEEAPALLADAVRDVVRGATGWLSKRAATEISPPR